MVNDSWLSVSDHSWGVAAPVPPAELGEQKDTTKAGAGTIWVRTIPTKKLSPRHAGGHLDAWKTRLTAQGGDDANKRREDAESIDGPLRERRGSHTHSIKPWTRGGRSHVSQDANAAVQGGDQSKTPPKAQIAAPS